MKKITLAYILIICVSSYSWSQTSFGPEETIDPNTGDNPYVLASGDLDGDSDIDIVMGTYDYIDGTQDVIKWYENDGLGNGGSSFSLSQTVSTTLQYIGGLAIANIDGMPGNDIIAASAVSNKVVYFANDGSGNFGAPIDIATGVSGAGQIVVNDLNKDGDLDLVIVAYGGDKVTWYRGDGTGSFVAQAPDISSVANSGPGAVHLADFDGDGDDDIVIGFTDLGTIEVYYNQYVSMDPDSVSWIKDTNTVDSGSTYLFVVQFADVDDDGQMEIIKSDTGFMAPGELAYYKKPDNTVLGGTYTETPIAASLNRPGVVKVLDLNNDTYSDIIVTNGETNGDDIIWFESTGMGPNDRYAEAMISDAQNQVFGIAIADFDNDSPDNDLDIVSVDFQNFDLNYFEQDPPALSVEDVDLNKIGLFPNPARNSLNFSGTTDIDEVQIFDLLGKEIMTISEVVDRSIDISQLQSGIYILRISEPDLVFKFIKE